VFLINPILLRTLNAPISTAPYPAIPDENCSQPKHILNLHVPIRGIKIKKSREYTFCEYKRTILSSSFGYGLDDRCSGFRFSA